MPVETQRISDGAFTATWTDLRGEGDILPTNGRRVVAVQVLSIPVGCAIEIEAGLVPDQFLPAQPLPWETLFVRPRLVGVPPKKSSASVILLLKG